jgi:mono/diheme cytochrome c family protein
VAVSLRDRNRVEIFEPGASADDALELRCGAAVAAEPVGLALTPDEAGLLVTSAWARKLSALDTATLHRRFEVDLDREPRAVLVDDDGERAFVAHVVGARLSVVDLASDKHEVRALDLRVKKVGTSGEGKQRGGCQGFALAKSIVAGDETAKAPIPAGEKPTASGTAPRPMVKAPAARAPRGRIFAPMVTVDPGEPTQRSAGYGSAEAQLGAEAPLVSVIDGAAERPLTRALLPDGVRHRGECLLPRAAAMSPRGDALFVTCLGLDALLELDARGLDPSRLETRRFRVPAGPTGVAIDAEAAHAVVWSQFDQTLALIDLALPEGSPAALIHASAAAPSRLPVAQAWGRKLFHLTDDPRVSGDGRACASCHPDGREDALTWSTPEGPRQTIMLAGRVAGSAPFGWVGAHEDLKTHVRTTFTRLGGSGLPDEPARFDELDALTAYVEGMRGPTLEGAVVDPERASLVARGSALFRDAAQGCAACHLGSSGTDAVGHDVGSSLGVDRALLFDTPSLRFVGGTAPYFHDGRYATLEELLVGADGKMGHTLQLSRRDVHAMRAYLETL